MASSSGRAAYHARMDEPPRPADPRPWKRLASERAPDLMLFQPRWDVLENPRNGKRLRRLVLETRDWVNVVARTLEGRFVVVRQYRFGTGRVTTEIPGGVIDPGEPARAAAERELLEETGGTAQRWTYLGAVEPNPAFHDNRCHHFLAEGVQLGRPQALDEGEDITVETRSAEELQAEVASGSISHALVLSALCRVLDLRPGSTGARGC